jgi:hypothetical protein
MPRQIKNMKKLVSRLSFTFLKIALAVLPLLIWFWYFEYQQMRWLSKLFGLIFPLTLFLLDMATRHPGDKSSQFYSVIGRFSTLRDRIVSLIAFILFLLLLSVPLFVSLSWQMSLAIMGFAFLIFYLIRFVFGTQELRESIKPRMPEIW